MVYISDMCERCAVDNTRQELMEMARQKKGANFFMAGEYKAAGECKCGLAVTGVLRQRLTSFNLGNISFEVAGDGQCEAYRGKIRGNEGSAGT